MNRQLMTFGILLLAAGCHVPADGVECAEELKAVPMAVSVRINVEDIVDDLVLKIGAQDYWRTIDSIETSCRPPELLPDLMDIPGGPDYSESMVVKPVKKVSIKGLSGIIFVYDSVGEEETMTGFAAALVEYREDGSPARAYKASELLRDEGWARLTSSTLTEQSINRCERELEYFTYSLEGDITGRLTTPIRTDPFCEQLSTLAP